jgi:Cu(I)/Ag(I) efflux system membrane fusion protein
MKTANLLIAFAACGLAAAGGYALYRVGVNRGMDMAAVGAAKDGGAKSDKKVLYWHDPMVPGQRFEKPGRSPFMEMDLVPVYAGDEGAADQGTISVNPRVQQNLGVRTAEVARGPLGARVEAAGSIAFNERDQAVVQMRATGYVERLHVHAMLDRVVKDQPLAELYVPEWVAPQQEFLSLRRMQPGQIVGLAELIDGARQRMRLAGMNNEQVRQVETSDALQSRITLRAPVSGIVTELPVREGMTAMPGATLFRINGLSTVWVNAEVPESQAALLRIGGVAEVRTSTPPGKIFRGSVQAILPEVNVLTRTVRARIELVNAVSDPHGQLMPGMFVSVVFVTPARQVLSVPTEAIIRTGRRVVVMLAEAEGRFRPVAVETGTEASGLTEIRRGLQAGQKVVVSGQFLLDSEASLRATTTRMQDMSVREDATSTEYISDGRIEVLGKDAVTLSHEPIPALKWGAMTMDFGRPASGSGLPPGLKPGQRVRFTFTMGKDGQPVLTRVEPGSKPAATGAMEKMP